MNLDKEIEVKIIKKLKNRASFRTPELAANLQIPEVQVMRIVGLMKDKNYIEYIQNDSSLIRLTNEGVLSSEKWQIRLCRRLAKDWIAVSGLFIALVSLTVSILVALYK